MNSVTTDTYRELFNLLNRMAEVKLPYYLRHSRPDAITIEVHIPGEHWEIDLVSYDDEVQVEVEVFRGGGVTGDEKTLEALFARWAE
jgi:hypothetical protein